MEAESQARSGFVTIVGPPNVGKSTLLNAILGQKIAIVTSKPQTTRDRILGVHTEERGQLVFLDTPGIHKPFKALNRAMVERAIATLDEVDVVLLVADATAQVPSIAEHGAIPAADQRVIGHVRETGKPTILALNKIDRVRSKEQLLPVIAAWQEALPLAAVVPVSALQGVGLDGVLDELFKLLVVGPAYYDPDTLTDRSTRFLVSEAIREKLMRHTGKEIPYSVAVEVERFEELRRVVAIDTVVHVERDSQKAVVIGKGGAMLKRVGSEARADIEELLGRKVMLRIFVRVEPHWSERRRGLRRFGYVDGEQR